MLYFNRRRIAFLSWIITASVLLSHYLVKADLPIHAALNDVKGTWRIYLSASNQIPELCGSHSPNRNYQNLAPELQNYKEWIDKNAGGIKQTLTLHLTDHRSGRLPADLLKTISITESHQSSHRNNWNALSVLQEKRPNGPLSLDDATSGADDPPVGSWTMIYDEGLEIHYGDDLTLTGFLSYSLSPVAEQCRKHQPLDTDQEDPDGKTECYITNPGKTSLGWFTDYSNKQRPQFGCWYGEKVSSSNGPITNSPFLYVAVKPNYVPPTTSFTDMGRNPLWTPTHDQLPEGTPSHLVRQSGWWKSTFPSQPYSNSVGSSFLTIRSSQDRQSYPCDLTSKSRKLEERIAALPKEFSSLPNPIAHSTGQSWTPPTTQGECGSCYAIASAYVLQARSSIQLNHLKKTNGHMDSDSAPEIPRPSVQSVLSCSFLNQGCNGGYPFLVGKWAQEFGLPSSTCQEYQRSDTMECKMNLTASAAGIEDSEQHEACSPKKSLYASGYGYVGGCYECCSEAAMMDEIYAHGPVVAAVDAPPNLFRYNEGIFNDADFHHARVCDDPQRDLNGWEFTNHAVVIVGWGEDKRTVRNGASHPVKYWIVRNSWGSNWGTGGYFKFLRGANLGGIEAQAVFLDPDFNRGVLAEETKKISQAYRQPLSTVLTSEESIHSLGVKASGNRRFPISPHDF